MGCESLLAARNYASYGLRYTLCSGVYIFLFPYTKFLVVWGKSKNRGTKKKQEENKEIFTVLGGGDIILEKGGGTK